MDSLTYNIFKENKLYSTRLCKQAITAIASYQDVVFSSKLFFLQFFFCKNVLR